MNAAGSHGGASTEETRVPVVIWNINGNLKNLTNNSSLGVSNNRSIRKQSKKFRKTEKNRANRYLCHHLRPVWNGNATRLIWNTSR